MIFGIHGKPWETLSDEQKKYLTELWDAEDAAGGLLAVSPEIYTAMQKANTDSIKDHDETPEE